MSPFGREAVLLLGLAGCGFSISASGIELDGGVDANGDACSRMRVATG